MDSSEKRRRTVGNGYQVSWYCQHLGMFPRHPVENKFSLNILRNLWSAGFYEGRTNTNYASLSTYSSYKYTYADTGTCAYAIQDWYMYRYRYSIQH